MLHCIQFVHVIYFMSVLLFGCDIDKKKEEFVVVHEHETVDETVLLTSSSLLTE